MSSVTIGFLVGGLTLALLAVRIHIGMAMLVGGSIGYIAVSGWQSAVVAYCLDGSEYEYIRVAPDHTFIDAMLKIEITFWTTNVMCDIPPEPVNSDDVVKLFPRSQADKVVDATAEIAQIVGEDILAEDDCAKRHGFAANRRCEFGLCLNHRAGGRGATV